MTNECLYCGYLKENAPQIEYFQMVFMPIAKSMGINCTLEIIRRGYYPKGGGEVHFKANPVKFLTPITLTDFGVLKRISGRYISLNKHRFGILIN